MLPKIRRNMRVIKRHSLNERDEAQKENNTK